MSILIVNIYNLLDSIRIERSGIVLDTNNYIYIFIILILFNFINIENKHKVTSIKNIYINTFHKVILISGTVGIIIALLSKDMVTIFLSIELYSISVSILIFHFITKDTIKYGIIYFLMSNISSAIFLFGLYTMLLTNENVNFLVLISILFKLGLFPFQLWILRIYPLLSNYLLSYILTLGKLPLFIFICRYIIDISQHVLSVYGFLGLLIIINILLATVSPIMYNRYKEILSWSSLLNMAYLLTFSISNSQGNMNITLLLYLINTIHLVSLNYTYLIYNNTIKCCFFISLFSLLGIPTLAGFFTKLYIIINSLSNLSILYSVILLISIVLSPIFYFYFIPKVETIQMDKDKQEFKLNQSIVTIILLMYVLFTSFIPIIL